MVLSLPKNSKSISSWDLSPSREERYKLKLRPLVLPFGHSMYELNVPYKNRVVERHLAPPRLSYVRVIELDSVQWLQASGV